MADNLTFTEFMIHDISKGDIGENLTKKDYENILLKKNRINIKKDNFLEETRIEEFDEFIWVFLKQGRAKPRAANVYNVATTKYEENPRSKEQVELNKQSYLIIHKNSNKCFISNLKKQEHFEEYLSSILSKKIGLSPVFKSIDEISKNLKALEEVNFVIKRDLFSSNNKSVNLFESGFEWLGLDRPDEFHIKARFSNNSNIASAFNFIKEIVKIPSATSISCTCTDAKKISYILNIDGACRKIVIPIKRSDDGLYNDEKLVKLFAEEFKKC